MDDTKRIKTIGDYQRLMDRFENTNDQLILPDLYIVLRVDAHRLAWKNTDTDYPFGAEFIKALRNTARELMCSGFRVSYTYIHGDEISILLDALESVNQRKRSRLLSLFSSYATAYFNRIFPHPVVFHSKMSELPSRSHVVDYFVWQRKVAARNFLTRQIIRRLQAEGLDAKEIDARTTKLSEDERRRALIDLGYPEEDLRMGDLYGFGIWWSDKFNGKPEMIGSESLGVSDDEYRDLLERFAFGPAPLIEEGDSASFKTETVKMTSADNSQRPPQLSPKKKPFRIA